MSEFSVAASGGEQEVPKLSFARKWGMLVVLSLALAIIILDTTILNVALSSIIQDLKTDIQSIQWVITAYSLTLAALTITGGRLGDIFGRKRMFILGAVLFGAGSFLASISTNVPMLIIGESLIEGIGAALMMPATSSLLVANFRGRERAIAFGIWGGIAGASAALGPILGGYFATEYSWRWGFRINLFVIAVLLLGSVLIPESKDTKEKPELDWFGVLLSATGLLSLVFGIIEAAKYGWWKAKVDFLFNSWTVVPPYGLSIVPFFILMGLIILSIFMVWELHREESGRTPLVSMKMFRNRRFTVGVVTVGVLALGQTGLIFSLPVFLQSVRGLNAFDTGIALLPMSLGLLIISPLSAALGRKVPPKLLVVLGLLINVIAYIVLYYTLNIDTTREDLILGLALFGIGMGMVMSQINNITLSSVPLHQAGEASGINNTLRQIGSALGSAIIGTVLIGTLSTRLADGINESAVIPDQVKPAISQAVASQTSNVEFGGGAQLSQAASPEIRAEILSIGHQATVDANRISLLFGAAFAALGCLVALVLPNKLSDDDLRHESEKPVKSEVEASPLPKQAHVQRVLDVAMIGELIETDKRLQQQGKHGLGGEVQTLLDLADLQESIFWHMDQRLVQGRTLWEKGIGKELGFLTLAEYIQSLPQVPPMTDEMRQRFPYLVLVDARVPAMTMCRLMGIPLVGNEMTNRQAHLQERGAVYWMLCQDGMRYVGESVQEVETRLEADERGLSASEGLALVAQYPSVIETHYLDLPKTLHDGFETSTACLGVWGGKLELRWRWRDFSDARCGAATKMV